MKTKYLLLITSLLAGSLLYAQGHTFNSLFEKYENGGDDVTIVSISKAMFKMIPGNINTGHVDIKDIVPKIESLLLISSDKSDVKERMYSEFKSLADKNYEELMRIKDGKSNIVFNVKKKGDMINELIMLINDEKDFVAIQLTGNFTMDDIQKVAQNTGTQ